MTGTEGYLPGQPVVVSPARATGLPLMNTLLPPPMTMPPQPDLSPVVTAGLPLMKTFFDPPATASPLSVASPLRAAGKPPMETLPLPCVITPGAPSFASCACRTYGATRRAQKIAQCINRMENSQYSRAGPQE